MNTINTNIQSTSNHPINGGTHQKMKFKVLTMKEWAKIHRDFKTIIDGQRYVMGFGTCGSTLEPVEIKQDATKLEAIDALKTLRRFLSAGQLSAFTNAMRSEEKKFFFNKAVELAEVINTMPVTYQTDGQGQEAIAQLHYFKNGCDWYITEKDMLEDQAQSFGLADMGDPELGYISINELRAVGAELDMYWQPKALKDIKSH
jgi:hypothetical protein